MKRREEERQGVEGCRTKHGGWVTEIKRGDREVDTEKGNPETEKYNTEGDGRERG